jgi:hypothetical protein
MSAKNEFAACQRSIECHKWHFTYFTNAGSPVAAAVYIRAMARVEHYMANEHAIKYQPKGYKHAAR